MALSTLLQHTNNSLSSNPHAQADGNTDSPPPPARAQDQDQQDEQPQPVLRGQPPPEVIQKVQGAFVVKLFSMVSSEWLSHLIAWSYDGSTFSVLNPQEFARSVLPLYFKHSNFQSFVRQLNIYGFHKVHHPNAPGPSSGNQAEGPWEFKHPFFRRDSPDLLSQVKRKSKNALLLPQQPTAPGGSAATASSSNVAPASPEQREEQRRTSVKRSQTGSPAFSSSSTSSHPHPHPHSPSSSSSSSSTSTATHHDESRASSMEPDSVASESTSLTRPTSGDDESTTRGPSLYGGCSDAVKTLLPPPTSDSLKAAAGLTRTSPVRMAVSRSREEEGEGEQDRERVPSTSSSSSSSSIERPWSSSMSEQPSSSSSHHRHHHPRHLPPPPPPPPFVRSPILQHRPPSSSSSSSLQYPPYHNHHYLNPYPRQSHPPSYPEPQHSSMTNAAGETTTSNHHEAISRQLHRLGSQVSALADALWQTQQESLVERNTTEMAVMTVLDVLGGLEMGREKMDLLKEAQSALSKLSSSSPSTTLPGSQPSPPLTSNRPSLPPWDDGRVRPPSSFSQYPSPTLSPRYSNFTPPPLNAPPASTTDERSFSSSNSTYTCSSSSRSSGPGGGESWPSTMSLLDHHHRELVSLGRSRSSNLSTSFTGRGSDNNDDDDRACSSSSYPSSSVRESRFPPIVRKVSGGWTEGSGSGSGGGSSLPPLSSLLSGAAAAVEDGVGGGGGGGDEDGWRKRMRR